MAQITSSTGLASGIDSKSIIDQLISIEEQPKVNLQARIDTENKKKAAYTDLQTRLLSIQLFGTTMKKPQSFKSSSVSSSDESSLTGTAAAGAAAGSYTLSVARLVSARQQITRGYADATKPVGAATLTLEMGGGDLDTPTNLDDLNGGAGVRRGQFRITDRSGNSTVIDTSDAVTLDDVVKKINTSLDVSVKASIDNDKLVLTDQTGQTSSNFRIDDVGSGHAATDLGIAQNVTTNTLTGTSIGGIGSSTKLSTLNDGRGIGTTGVATSDFSIAIGGTTKAITLNGATTVGDVISRINAAIGVAGTASIDGGGIKITDAGGGTVTVAAMNSSTAAADLGLEGTGTGSVGGKALTAGIDTTLVSSLRGGQGLDLGEISITNRLGVAATVDLTGAATVAEINKRISAAGIKVDAAVKSGGNGITLTDSSGGTGSLVVSDVSGQGAAQLGLVGTFADDAAHQTVSGANLQKAWFSGNTLLKDLGGGKGVTDGSFTITDSSGKTRTIDIDSANDTTVDDVIKKINTGTFGVTASINANGDGLLLTDTAGGSLQMKVDEVNSGGTAKSLNILGASTNNQINGTWEKTVTIGATDKLTDVATKITNAGWGLSAAVINDGSAGTPYRLSLTSTRTGRDGRVVFDSGALNLGERTLVEAQDAAVFVGSSDSSSGDAQPMLITAASNTVTGAIRGVTLNLQGVSKEPVTINVARNVDNVVDATNKFVEDFNGLVTQLKTYTAFDSSTNTAGDLLGDPAASSIESEIYGMLNTVGSKTGKYRTAGDVGISVGDDGQIAFDETKFRDAYADDPDGVTSLFTRAGNALTDDYQVSGLRNNQGLRTTAPGQPDFNISTKDGTSFDVDASDLSTVSQLIDAINNATGNNGKVVAAINSLGTGINLVDKSTTGTKAFQVATMNGSIAASDLGLLTSAVNGTITGRSIVSSNSGDDGGLATQVSKQIARLIDPSTGVVTEASNEVDARNKEFNDRIASIDTLVADKRTRLEKQFADMETSISKLKSQQSALSSFTPAA